MILTEQQQTMLEKLVFDGEVTTKKDILQGMVSIELLSLNGVRQLAVEKAMSKVDGPAVFTLHTYSILSLAQSLLSVTAKDNTIKFKDAAEAQAFIESRSSAMIDAMIKAHSEFEKELKELSDPSLISENFSQTPGTVGA